MDDLFDREQNINGIFARHISNMYKIKMIYKNLQDGVLFLKKQSRLPTFAWSLQAENFKSKSVKIGLFKFKYMYCSA